jgi:hypothetical protein
MTAHPFRGHRWRLVRAEAGHGVSDGRLDNRDVTACLYRCDRAGCTEARSEIIDGHWTLADLTKDLTS